MLKHFNFQYFLNHFLNAVRVVVETPKFIQTHKLWKGFFDYRWLTLMSILISLLFTYIVYENLTENYFPLFPEEPMVDPESVKSEKLSDLKDEGRKGVVTSGTKYLLVILLEMVVYYFSFKTLFTLGAKSDSPSFKDFINAEKRMIRIMISNFVKGVIVNIVVSIVTGLLNIDFLNPFLMFFVYAYFMGYAFLDNYNEQYRMEIKESQVIIRKNVGAALAIGLIVSMLIYVPLIGPLLGPIFGAVAAAIYGHRYQIEGQTAVLELESE
ncbi:EI24 domain-containing protein [Portibacter marinus]|uniref:EI24 domain-containing protein n=1 Tax=Portibacter marinus TaxID=2898660 RepID=UPI001F35922F|nr:EI24 domain-containing protein [Portibacter marinus]